MQRENPSDINNISLLFNYEGFNLKVSTAALYPL